MRRFFMLTLVGLLGIFAACESDTETTFTPLLGVGIDSAHLHLPDSVLAITLQPVNVVVRIDSSATFKDSLIIYSYAHGSVLDTAIFQIRKPTVVLGDTLHIYYNNLVQNIDTITSEHQEYFKLDSVRVKIAKGKACAVITRYP